MKLLETERQQREKLGNCQRAVLCSHNLPFPVEEIPVEPILNAALARSSIIQ
jgi:hypothetical protein